MITVKISDDAVADLNEGFLFYEVQEFGLGDYFLSHLRADIEGLKVTGGIHQIVYDDYHRVLSRVFPYAIFYTYKDNIAVVWAIVDCRRDPAWIEAHVRQIRPNR